MSISLEDYQKNLAEWESKVDSLYAQVQALIPSELREAAKALQERERQLYSQAIGKKNLVIDMFQFGSAYKNLCDRTINERNLLQVVAGFNSP